MLKNLVRPLASERENLADIEEQHIESPAEGTVPHVAAAADSAGAVASDEVAVLDPVDSNTDPAVPTAAELVLPQQSPDAAPQRFQTPTENDLPSITCSVNSQVQLSLEDKKKDKDEDESAVGASGGSSTSSSAELSPFWADSQDNLEIFLDPVEPHQSYRQYITQTTQGNPRLSGIDDKDEKGAACSQYPTTRIRGGLSLYCPPASGPVIAKSGLCDNLDAPLSLLPPGSRPGAYAGWSEFSQSYLNSAWNAKTDPGTGSLSKAENIVRTLIATLTYTAALLILCPGLPEMIFGTMLPVLAPMIDLFAQYVFPWIAVLEVWSALSAIVRFAEAPNKNLEKTAELLLALSAAAITISAVALFLWGASTILVTGLLLYNIGLVAFYHSVQFLHHLYLFLSEPLVSVGMRSFFRGKALDHLSSVTTGLALATGLTFCFLLPALGITLGPVVVAVMFAVATIVLSNLVYRCCQQAQPLSCPQTASEIYGGSKWKAILLPKARTGFYATEGYSLHLVRPFLKIGSSGDEDVEALTSPELRGRDYLRERFWRKIDSLTSPGDTQATVSEARLGKARRLIHRAVHSLYVEEQVDGHIDIDALDPEWEKLERWVTIVQPDFKPALGRFEFEVANSSVEEAKRTLLRYQPPPLRSEYQSFFRNRGGTQELVETTRVHDQARTEAMQLLRQNESMYQADQVMQRTFAR